MWMREKSKLHTRFQMRTGKKAFTQKKSISFVPSMDWMRVRSLMLRRFADLLHTCVILRVGGNATVAMLYSSRKKSLISLLLRVAAHASAMMEQMRVVQLTCILDEQIEFLKRSPRVLTLRIGVHFTPCVSVRLLSVQICIALSPALEYG